MANFVIFRYTRETHNEILVKNEIKCHLLDSVI